MLKYCLNFIEFDNILPTPGEAKAKAMPGRLYIRRAQKKEKNEDNLKKNEKMKTTSKK